MNYFAGFDPGSRFVGVTVLDDRGDIVQVEAWPLGGGSIEDRLHTLAQRFQAWSYRNQLFSAAIETQFSGKNPRDNRTLTLGAGTLYGLLLLSHRMPIFEVYPVQAKATLTRNPKASKDEMVAFARLLWPGLDGILKSHGKEDAADSVGIALHGYGRWKDGLCLSTGSLEKPKGRGSVAATTAKGTHTPRKSRSS
jgi:Holliday junction resolvasome RuvABC endonuclease subunit